MEAVCKVPLLVTVAALPNTRLLAAIFIVFPIAILSDPLMVTVPFTVLIPAPLL